MQKFFKLNFIYLFELFDCYIYYYMDIRIAVEKYVEMSCCKNQGLSLPNLNKIGTVAIYA